MKVEISVQYRRERHSNMIKISQLAPDSVQPLKDQLIADFRKDWKYFGLLNIKHGPFQFQWEVGRVRSFWELEKDTPPHHRLYDILSRISPDDLDLFSIAQLALREDDCIIERNLVLAAVRTRLHATIGKFTDVGVDATSTTLSDTENFGAPFSPGAKAHSKRKRTDFKQMFGHEAGAMGNLAPESKRFKVCESDNVEEYSTSGDHPPDICLIDLTNISDTTLVDKGEADMSVDQTLTTQLGLAGVLGDLKESMVTAAEIQCLKSQLEMAQNECRAARNDLLTAKRNYQKWFKAEHDRGKACKERSNFHKDDAAKLRHQLAQVLKDKEDLQTSFEEERESFKAEIDELRAKSSNDDFEVQRKRYVNANEQLKKDLEAARNEALDLRKQLSVMRGTSQVAQQNADEAEQARKVAETKLQRDVEVIAKLQLEKKELMKTKTEQVDARLLVLQHDNEVLQDRLDDLNDDLVNQKMLTKKKIEVIKRSGEQLRAEKAKNDGLQKDLEHEQQQLEALKRKNNPMLMERDGWNRRALAAEHKLSQLQEEMTRKAAASKAEKDDLRVKVQELTAQLANTATEDMAFKDATNEAEKDELRAKILGLEVELASATTERSGAFGNVANRQVHNSENLQASPELHVKAKNATIKKLRQDLVMEKELRMAAECGRLALRQIQYQTYAQLEEIQLRVTDLEQASADVIAQLTAALGENESLKSLQRTYEQAILVEKNAQLQTEDELRKVQATLHDVNPRVLPAFMKALEQVARLTVEATK